MFGRAPLSTLPICGNLWIPGEEVGSPAQTIADDVVVVQQRSSEDGVGAFTPSGIEETAPPVDLSYPAPVITSFAGEDFAGFPLGIDEHGRPAQVFVDTPITASFAGEDIVFTTTAALEEASSTATALDIVNVTQSPPGEESRGTMIDEYGIPAPVIPEPFWIVAPPSEEPVGTMVDEYGLPAPVIPEPFWITAPPSEDFGTATYVDEYGVQAPVAPEPQWITAPPPEDFSGSIPNEEVAIWQWTAVEPPLPTIPPSHEEPVGTMVDEHGVQAPVIPEPFWIVAPPPEDFGGVHPTEETFAPIVIVLEAPVSLWPPSEEPVGTMVDEYGVPAPVIPEPFWIVAPPNEEPVGTMIDEYGVQAPVIHEPFWITHSINEDFGTSSYVDEHGVQAPIIPETFWIVAPPTEEPVGTMVDEYGIAAHVIPEPQWIAAPPSEDFGTASYIDEYGVQATVVLESLWIVAPPSEDFQGSIPNEETSTWQWTPTEPPSWFTAVPEDFAGSIPSEEVSTFLFVPTELTLSFAFTGEDFAGSIVDEYGVPAPVAPELPPLQQWPSSEEIVVTVTQIVEEYSPPWTVFDTIPLSLWPVGEDIITPSTTIVDETPGLAWIAPELATPLGPSPEPYPPRPVPPPPLPKPVAIRPFVLPPQPEGYPQHHPWPDVERRDHVREDWRERVRDLKRKQEEREAREREEAIKALAPEPEVVEPVQAVPETTVIVEQLPIGIHARVRAEVDGVVTFDGSSVHVAADDGAVHVYEGVTPAFRGPEQGSRVEAGQTIARSVQPVVEHRVEKATPPAAAPPPPPAPTQATPTLSYNGPKPGPSLVPVAPVAGVAASPPVKPGSSTGASLAKAALVVAAGVAGAVLIAKSAPTSPSKQRVRVKALPARAKKAYSTITKAADAAIKRLGSPRKSYHGSTAASPARQKGKAGGKASVKAKTSGPVTDIRTAVDYPAHAAIYEKWIKCGKAACLSCPHGPYYYAKWDEGGRTMNKYLGRKVR